MRSQVCDVWDGEGRAIFARRMCGCARGRRGFVLETPLGDVEMRSPLTGRVNVYNLLAASCAALARGLTLEQIVAGAAAGAQVPGRFEVVPSCE